MALSLYKKIIEKLAVVLPQLNSEVSVTLGNEQFKHPQINEIIAFTSAAIPEYFSYDDFSFPTTGIALMEREDKEQIISSVKAANAESVMLTIHGNEIHHNAMVGNSKGFSSILSAVDFFRTHGFHVEFYVKQILGGRLG